MAAEDNGSVPAVRNLIRLAEVQKRTALSRSSIYAKVAEGTFPRPVKRGSSSVWVDTEVQAWIDELIASRDQRAA
ncbi:AlpA family phage regulatory protein [Luteibacter sp. PPL201]|uniref:AlpA family phage regulatory protein n=1 Tax=Luteibacter sahnii TaxID=3021977 RepID=A0ABT6B7N3_9GAMM